MPDDAEIIQLMKEDIRSSGRYGVVKGLDGDKKQAADSLAIEKDTTADSQRVYGDYDNFNQRRKSELAQGLVEKDDRLLKYIEANPLHSTVSKDDWGNLSNFTQAARQLLPTETSYFMRGLASSLTKEQPELVAEFMEGMSYHMPEALRPTMMNGAKAVRDFSLGVTPGGYEKTAPDLWDIKGIGDAWAWGMENLGSGLGSMLPSLALGGAGVLAGTAVGGPVGGIIGGAAGAGGVSYAMGYGEVYKALKDEGIDPKQAATIAGIAATPIAALDLASLGFIVSRFGGAQLAKKELTRAIARKLAVIAAAEGATTESITEGLQEVIKDAAVSLASGKDFVTKEHIKGWVENALVGGMVGGVAGGGFSGASSIRTIRKTADRTERTIDNARPWVAAGEHPPLGVDPIIDHLIGLESEQRMKILDGIMENAEKTETKELSPEAWQNLTQIVFGRQFIEIRPDAVKALYGDKIPAPDDGMLGFVPDITQQIANSDTTTEKIKVKLSDWIGKVDPEINKLLHDELSFPDGISISEAKEQPTLNEATQTTEIPETAFPPMAQELDLPYSLVKGDKGLFKILDEHGDQAAEVSISETEGGKNLHVHWETGQVDVAGLRTMMNQLKQMYPNAETISTPRVPGTESLRRGLQGSKITIDMPFRVKETTVDIVRKSGALEPLFDLPKEGPRAIRLVRNKGIPIAPGDVNFTITDENGNPVGEVTGALRQKGRDYYIDWIGAPLDDREVGGNLVNKLGPKLIRGLFREFKRELPQVKTLTGFRVTGARGTYSEAEVVTIDLARLMEEQEKAPAGWEGAETSVGPETQKLVDMTQGWAKFGGTLIAQRQREWTPQELALESKITKLLNKIAPKEVRVTGAEDIRIGDEQRRVYGVMQMYYDRRPLIMWSLEGPDAVGTARHEAVHFLRQYGYLNDKEWAILEKHVKDNDLIKKHGIDSRYPKATEEQRIEEAIAEEFRTWAREPDSTHPFAKAFQVIKEILENIKSAYREYLGREPTIEDIFKDIDIGRVGRRTPGQAVEPRVHRTLAQEMSEDDILKDVGFTDSEIRHGVSEERKAKVREGHLFWGGELQKATPELLKQFKDEAAKDLERKAEATKKLNTAFAQKASYPPLQHILGSDWGAGSRGNTPSAYRNEAYRTLNLKYGFNQMMVEKVERAIARQPAAYDPGGPVEGEVPTFQPGAIMDKARYAKYQKLINQRNREDTDKERVNAEKEVKRRLTPEWKKNWKDMSAEVAPEIANKPEWKVSQFFRNGMFFGMDTKYRPKIDPKYLTPEQRKGLPEQFMTKGGMDPDALAGGFGYSSGSTMVDKMIDFERTKGKLGPKEFFEKVVKEETDRRMEFKYGKLGDNILKEAMDHVTGTTQMDLLHEETVALAMRAGQGVPLSKEDIRKNQSRRFHDEVAQGVTMRGYFRDMYRAGKAAELAFLNGDYVEAFKQKQAQVNLFALAEHAKKFEKVQDKFDDIIKEFNKRDHDPKKIPAEFVEWMHQILFQIKRPPKRLPEDLARMVAIRPYKTLGEFADYHNVLPAGAEEYEGDMNPTIVIWDKLMEVDAAGMPTWTKDFEDLTVGEVKAVNDSLQSLKFIGRKEGKYLVMGESHVKSQIIGNMDNQLSTLGVKKDIIKDTALGKTQDALQWMKGGLLQLEAMFDRWDKGNQRGIFTKMFSYPLTEASNRLSTMQRTVARMIVKADKEFGLSKKQIRTVVDNDVFYDPRFMEEDPDKPGKWRIPPDGQNWMRMTKEHVRGVILNWGNKSNRQRLAEGYYVTVDQIQAWLDKVSDKSDWDWAREVGRIYEHIQKDSDEMTFEMSGTLVEMLPLENFQTRFGEYEGWYYPIIYDRTKMGGPRLREEPPPPTVARTYTGWERKRSGSAGPLDLSLAEMQSFMSRRLKDNAFRPVLSEIHKIWADKGFRKSVSKYYGDYAVKMLDNAYNDFAGRTGLTTGASQAGNQFAELVRQNTIGALIAFNPGTVMKHGPSALFQSWGQAGIFKPDFYKSTLAMVNPITAPKNYSFMMHGDKVGTLDWQGSEELQRRHQHWAETIGGAGDIQMRRMTWRESFLYYGSYPVAWSDMASSTILWKAKYDKTMAELQTWPIEQAHTEAVRLADYAIRMTHGSTAITSRPEFMRSTNTMTRYLTSLYGFFNHVFNRFYRMSWKSKDLFSDRWNSRIGNKEFAKGFGELTSDFMMYIVLPSAVEALVVEGLMSQDWDDKGWGELLGNGMIHTVGASIPIVREVVHAVGTGHDPTIGLLGTAAKGYSDFVRQVNPNKEVYDVGKIIQNIGTVAGISTGMGGTQVGRWARFTYDFIQDEQAPSGPADWYRAFRSGNIEPRRGH